MQRIKRLNKHFKPAQQIVELALVLPFFIITFSFVFQLMVETYSKYRFSYIFTNAVARAIELQQKQLIEHPYTTLDDTLGFDFKHNVWDITRVAMQRVPNSGIQIADLQLDGINNYLSGIYINDVERIIFKDSGLEYFYFIVPVSRIYFQPMVLNIDNMLLEEFFTDWYFFELASFYKSALSGGGAGSTGNTGGETSESSAGTGLGAGSTGEGTGSEAGTGTGGSTGSGEETGSSSETPLSPPGTTGGMSGEIPDTSESKSAPEAEPSGFYGGSPWGKIEAAE